MTFGPAVTTDQAGNRYTIQVDSADGSYSLITTPTINPPTPPPNGVPTTALDLIKSALRLINAYAPGQQLDIGRANDALTVLNQMIDGWNAERLAIYSIQSQDFAFILGQQAYTMGIGGDFNVNRPAKITGISSILIANPSNPIEVPITMYTWSEWQLEMPVKTVDSSFPQICYDDGGFPVRTLNFWPIPTLQQNNVRIYSWQALAEPSTLQTTIAFPPGYAEAFRFNLAVRLAPDYQAQLSPIVQGIAIESLARIRTMNAPQLDLRSDLIPTEGGYNYKADLFNIPY